MLYPKFCTRYQATQNIKSAQPVSNTFSHVFLDFSHDLYLLTHRLQYQKQQSLYDIRLVSSPDDRCLGKNVSIWLCQKLAQILNIVP